MNRRTGKNYLYKPNILPLTSAGWEQGTLSLGNPVNPGALSRIRTIDYIRHIPNYSIYITINNLDYKCAFFCYDESHNYLGVYPATGVFVTESGSYPLLENTMYFKVVAMHDNQTTNLTPSVMPNLITMKFTN